MGLRVLRAATTAGKPVIGESAVGRGKGAPFAFADSLYSKHVNAFTYPPMACSTMTLIKVPLALTRRRLRNGWFIRIYFHRLVSILARFAMYHM